MHTSGETSIVTTIGLWYSTKTERRHRALLMPSHTLIVLRYGAKRCCCTLLRILWAVL